jgi:hypothetical protein
MVILLLLQLAMQERETTLMEDDRATLEEIGEKVDGCTVVCRRELGNGRVLCQGSGDRGVSDDTSRVLKVGNER